MARWVVLAASLLAGCSSAPPTPERLAYKHAFKSCVLAFSGTNIAYYYGWLPRDYCRMYGQRAMNHQPLPRLP